MSVTLSSINKFEKASSIPAALTDSHTKAWYISTEGVTLSGSYVTQWDDQSGNNYDLISYAVDGSAASDSNRPTYSETDGIVYDGLSGGSVSKVMIAGWTTYGTVYAVVKQVSWQANGTLFSYAGTGGEKVAQSGTTPNIVNARSSGASPAITNFTVGTFGILILRTITATPVSQLSLNGGTDVENTNHFTGYTSGGILLGAAHAAAPALQRYGNVAIKEIIWRDQVDNSTDEDIIYNYLATKYSI